MPFGLVHVERVPAYIDEIHNRKTYRSGERSNCADISVGYWGVLRPRPSTGTCGSAVAGPFPSLPAPHRTAPNRMRQDNQPARTRVSCILGRKEER
jgi:hypothetical protein